MRRLAGATAITVALLAGSAAPARADVRAWDFEPGEFRAGDPFDGQGGWSMTGNFDVAVVRTAGFGNPAGFGTQSLRVSNADASSGFSNQPRSPSLADPAGESTAVSTSGASGDTQPHFDLRFQFRSAAPGDEQQGLAVQVGPSDGGTTRQGVLTILDDPTGLRVDFFDTPDPTCATGAAGCVAFRRTTVVGGLTRGDVHRVRLTLDFVEGPDNDVAQVFIDGSLRFTGTSWENYYRNDPEQAGNGNRLPLIDTALVRVNQQASTRDRGLLVDNVRIQTSSFLTLPGGGGTIVIPPVPGQPGAETPMRIVAASLNRRTRIVRARLVCPPEAVQCAASVTVRGNGNLLARRDLVRSGGVNVTVRLGLTPSRFARLRRARTASITVFSRNQQGVSSRIRQRLSRR